MEVTPSISVEQVKYSVLAQFCFIEVNGGFSNIIQPMFATSASSLRLQDLKHCSPLLRCPYTSKPAGLQPQHLIALYSSSCECSQFCACYITSLMIIKGTICTCDTVYGHVKVRDKEQVSNSRWETGTTNF